MAQVRRSIGEMWQDYCRAVWRCEPENLPATQLLECRRCFYAGAKAVYDYQMNAAFDVGGEATNADLEAMAKLDAKLNQFLADVLGRMSTDHHLRVTPSFDWSRLQWRGPNAPVSWTCSYCGEAIPEDEDSCPLRLWKPDGSGAVLCDLCAGDAFGLRRCDPPPEANDERDDL